jgi:hypothetical protein
VLLGQPAHVVLELLVDVRDIVNSIQDFQVGHVLGVCDVIDFILLSALLLVNRRAQWPSKTTYIDFEDVK